MHSSDLPPAFSARQRAREPFLAEEDSNGLFQAFRAHRLRRDGRRAWRRWPRAVVVGGVLFALMAIGVFILTMRSIRPWSAVWMIFIIIPLLQLFLAGARSWRGGLRLPPYLTEVLASPDAASAGLPPARRSAKLQSQAARDLWLVPADGREVLVALYLESREQALALRGVGLGIAGITCVSLWLFLHGSDRLVTDTLLLLPGTGILAWGIVRVADFTGEESAVNQTLALRVAAWEPPAELPKVLAQVVFRIGAVLGLIHLGAACLPPAFDAIGTAGRALLGLLPDLGIRNFIRAHPRATAFVIVNVLLTLVGIALLRYPERNTARVREKREELLAEGRMYYEDFMRRKVLEEG